MSSRALASPAVTEAVQHEHFGDAFTEALDCWTRMIDRANARRVRRVLERVIPSGSRILEIGPGRGATLMELDKAGFCVEGLELSSVAARAASSRTAVPVHVGTVDRWPAAGAKCYDALIVRHVLEHMADPVAAIAALHGLLRPGGVVYVAVPNIEAFEAALPGWAGYQAYHLHYFSPAGLRGLFERAGFGVLVCRTREPFSGWVNAIANTVLGAGRGHSSSSYSRRCGAFVTAAYNLVRLGVGALLTPLRVMQARSGRGEEIELVGRKPA